MIHMSNRLNACWASHLQIVLPLSQASSVLLLLGSHSMDPQVTYAAYETASVWALLCMSATGVGPGHMGHSLVGKLGMIEARPD